MFDGEREGYVKVGERIMKSGQKVIFWCPTDPNAPSLEEVMLDVYRSIGEAYKRKQEGHLI